MKAFVLTIDAMIAVSFLFMALLILSAQTFQPLAPRGIHMKQMTLDALTVMEKSGALYEALDGNSSEVRRLLEYTPELMCMHIQIRDDHGGEVALISKNDCGKLGREYQSATRDFIYDGEPYSVKADSWYKREER